MGIVRLAQTVSAIAAEDLTGKEGYVAYLSDTDKVSLAGATQATGNYIRYIIVQGAASGKAVELVRIATGQAYCIVASAAARGAKLALNADGKLTPTVSSNDILAKLITPCTAANQILAAELTAAL